MRRAIQSIGLLVMMGLFGCTEGPGFAATTPAPSAEAGVTGTATRIPIPTSRLTDLPGAPTRTPRPTRTPGPTNTPRPTATATQPLSTSGPLLLYVAPPESGESNMGLWAINPDASGQDLLVNENIEAYAVQPGKTLADGVMVAYISRTLDDSARDLTLKILHLPERTVETITPLLTTRGDGTELDLYTALNAVHVRGLVWSPDGRYIAFVGQIYGRSMDAYTYDTLGLEIVQQSAGVNQAYDLQWSPDSRHLVLGAFTYAGMGELESVGLWSSNLTGEESISLLDIVFANGSYRQISYVGWADNLHLLLVDRHYSEPSPVYSVNVFDGATEMLFETEQEAGSLYAPEIDTWLVRSCCSDTPRPLKMFTNGNLVDIGPYRTFRTLKWWPDLEMFLGVTDTQHVITISPDGEIASLDFDHPRNPYVIASPDGELWAWIEGYDYYTGEQPTHYAIGRPLERPTTFDAESGSILAATWSPDSRRLFLLTTAGLIVAERGSFAPVDMFDIYYQDNYSLQAVKWIP